ncbi:MAG TPA: serine/threonine-protein kinase [Polyangiaceae bacterium]
MIGSASRASPGLEIPFLETEPVSLGAKRPGSFPDAAPLEPGALIADRYRVLRKIGEGGMGVLYACLDTVLTRDVAVKLMQRSLAADPQLSERLLREARLAAQLRSHVAQVFDCGTLATGEPYIVMELLAGRDLYAVLKDSGRLTPDELCSAMKQVCVGLAEAHDKGIIHRDLKPENLFCALEPDGTTVMKIVDFGVSKQLTNRMRSVTNPTESVGSPQYMSPEQITTPSDVDGRTDIWSLGVVMFELLTGALPFNGPGPAQVCASVLSHPVPAISEFRDDVPPALEFIVLRCLEKVRERRFASVSELSAALSAFLATGTLPSALLPAPSSVAPRRVAVARPPRRWTGALFSIVVLGACAGVLGVGIREGRIHVPTKAEVMNLPASLSSLRLSLEQRFGRQSTSPAHPSE